MGRPATDRPRPNAQCGMSGKIGRGNIVLHGFLRLKRGRRRRYQYEACGRTFVSSLGPPVPSPQVHQSTVRQGGGPQRGRDVEVWYRPCDASVVEHRRPMAPAGRRSRRTLQRQGAMLTELQADEIRTFIDSKKRVQWVLAAIEVCLDCGCRSCWAGAATATSCVCLQMPSTEANGTEFH